MPSRPLLRYSRLILALTALATVLSFAFVLSPKSAHAAAKLCIAQKEEGNWVNTDPNTRSITRIVVWQSNCEVPGGAPYYVHLYGACSPSACDWGTAPARRLPPSASQPHGPIYALYDQGFAKRDVFVSMSKYRAGQLWVDVRTTFTDGRAPYESQDWFIKR